MRSIDASHGLGVSDSGIPEGRPRRWSYDPVEHAAQVGRREYLVRTVSDLLARKDLDELPLSEAIFRAKQMIATSSISDNQGEHQAEVPPSQQLDNGSVEQPPLAKN